MCRFFKLGGKSVIYEFRCANGHTTERCWPSSKSDVEATNCDHCDEMAQRVVSLPTMIGFEGASAQTDERIYRQHNVTREETLATPGGGTVSRAPVSISDGCRCGNCSAHTRRNGITGTAEPGKVR